MFALIILASAIHAATLIARSFQCCRCFREGAASKTCNDYPSVSPDGSDDLCKGRFLNESLGLRKMQTRFLKVTF